MITIPVHVCGDSWHNSNSVKQKLNKARPNDCIALDFGFEAPCIKLMGLVDILTACPTQNIILKNWPNLSNPTAYSTTYTDPISHFFYRARDYWPDNVVETAHLAYKFGLFLGRDTRSRNTILYEVAHEYSHLFLLSKLNQLYANPWNLPAEIIDFEADGSWSNGQRISQWLETHPIKSLDSRQQMDQYNLGHGIVFSSLLGHYNNFEIELVCESYTLGDTFFPTEKTVRPLMAAKPILVYGPRHFLKNLQALGFQTYSSCWDESYDELEGFARWQAIKKLLPQIESSDKSLAIAVQNRQHLANLIDNKCKSFV